MWKIFSTFSVFLLISVITADDSSNSTLSSSFSMVLYPPQSTLEERCPDYDEAYQACSRSNANTVTKTPVKCNCRFFYECENNWLTKVSCLENHAFNPIVSSCDLPRNLSKNYKYYCPYLPNQWCPC